MLKLQFFGYWMQRVDSLEKTLMLRKIEGEGEGDDRGWDGWMASPTCQTWVWASFGSWWWTGKPGVLQSLGSQRVGHGWVICTCTWSGYLSPSPRLHWTPINYVKFHLKNPSVGLVSDCSRLSSPSRGHGYGAKSSLYISIVSRNAMWTMPNIVIF